MLPIQFPIIQAPMAGGIIPVEFAAQVSNAGCLGSLAAGGLSLEVLNKQLQHIRTLTSQPYQVNLFSHPQPHVNEMLIKTTNEQLNTIRKSLNIPVVNEVIFKDNPTIEDYVQCCIDYQVPIVSFTFGAPDKSIVDKLKSHNIIVIGTVTTVGEALHYEAIGADLVVAQGYEAGGHQGGRGSSSIGLMSLVPQIKDAVQIPVIAAGGIADRRGIQACMALGADYVQIGTRFLNTFESTAHPLHKEAINNADETQAQLTTSFTGKKARGIHNKMMTLFNEVPDYPLMNQMTTDIRAAAKKIGATEYMSNWSGQNIRTSTTLPLADVLNELISPFK